MPDYASLRHGKRSRDWKIQKDRTTFLSAWFAFLVSANGVYSKLEQGAKANNKSKGWYGRAKHIRRTDELLRYLHHARDTELHGIGSSTLPKGPKLELAKEPNPTVPEDRKGKEIIAYWNKDIPGQPVFRITLGGLVLVPVTSEFGDTFNVPKTHLGKKLSDGKIADVAKLALDYLEGLVEEASTYVIK